MAQILIHNLQPHQEPLYIQILNLIKRELKNQKTLVANIQIQPQTIQAIIQQQKQKTLQTQKITQTQQVIKVVQQLKK